MTSMIKVSISPETLCEQVSNFQTCDPEIINPAYSAIEIQLKCKMANSVDCLARPVCMKHYNRIVTEIKLN